MKNVLATYILTLTAYIAFAQGKDTFEVHFALGISSLNKESQTYIDRLIQKENIKKGDKLIVLGYADFVGGKGYNDTLSLVRAANVRKKLLSAGFEIGDVKLCMGKGKISRASEKGKRGYAPDRKVQIIIDRIAMAAKPPEKAPPKIADGDIDIDKLEVNQTFALNNIYFKLNSPEILDKSKDDLDRLLNFLNRYPNVKVQIEGHVCCMGPVEGTDSKYKRRNLSECRAEAIYNYLVEKGVTSDRMKYAGLANRNPVVPNEITEADRQKNRRVEVRLLSK